MFEHIEHITDKTITEMLEHLETIGNRYIENRQKNKWQVQENKGYREASPSESLQHSESHGNADSYY